VLVVWSVTMKGSLKFSSVITHEGRWYIAHCPELDIASQGKSVESALKNLREAIELYLEDEHAKVPDAMSEERGWT